MNKSLDDDALQTVVNVGRAIGLLHPTEGGPVDVNGQWFFNPGDEAAEAFSRPEGRQALIAALDALLDGAPGESDPSRRRIPLPDTGCDLVLTVDPDTAALEVGLGGSWTLTDTADARCTLEAEAIFLRIARNGTAPHDVRSQDISFPLRLDAEVAVVFHDTDVPIEALDAGLSVQRDADGTVRFDVQADVDPRGADLPPFTLAYSTDDAQGVEEQLVTLGIGAGVGLLQVLLAAGEEASATVREAVQATLGNLLGLFGLAPTSRHGTAHSLPVLDLSQLTDDAATALQAWLSAVVATEADAQRAVELMLCLILGRHDLPAPSGSIDLGLPHDLAVAATAQAPSADARFEVLLWRAADADGVDRAYLGVRVTAASATLQPQPSLTFQAGLNTQTTLCSLNLTGAPSVRAEGDTTLALTLTNPAGDVVSVSADGDTFGIGSVQAGLTLSPSAGATPTLALLDVSGPAGLSFDRYDLLDLDNLAKAGAAAAAGGLAAALQSWLGVDPADLADVAGRVAGLLGLQPVASAPAGWPTLDLAALAADPGAAYAAWFNQLLVLQDVDGDGDADDRLFSTWLERFGDSLSELTGSPVTVTGQGTEPDPWVLAVFAGPPAVGLHVWLADAPTGRLALRTALVVKLDDIALIANEAELDNRLQIGLLDLNAPALVGGSGDVTTQWLSHVAFVSSLNNGSDPVEVPLTTPVSGELQFGSLDLELGWRAGEGFVPDAVLRSFELNQTGVPQPLLQEDELRLSAITGAQVDEAVPRVVSVLLPFSLSRVSTPASDRALLVPRLLGYWPPTDGFTALTAAEVDTLLGNLPTELARLLARRLAETTPTPEALRQEAVELLWHAVFDHTAASQGPTPQRPEVLGDGTWDTPWAVRLQDTGDSSPVELLVWLDPDGPQLPVAAQAGFVDALVPAASLGSDPAWADLHHTLRGVAQYDAPLRNGLFGVSATSFQTACTRLQTVLSGAPELASNATLISTALGAAGTAPVCIVRSAVDDDSTWAAVRTALGSRTVHELDVHDVAAVLEADTAAAALSAAATALAGQIDDLGLTNAVLLGHDTGRAVINALASSGGFAGRVSQAFVVGMAPGPTDPVLAGVHLRLGAAESSGEGEALAVRLLDRVGLTDSLGAADLTGGLGDEAFATALARVRRAATPHEPSPLTGLPRVRPTTRLEDLAGGGPLAPGITPIAPTAGGFAKDLWLRFARQQLTAAAAQASARNAATHIGFGLRVHGLTTQSGLTSDNSLGLHLFRVPLTVGAPDVAAHAVPAMTVQSSLWRDDDWLLGDGNEDPRAHWLRFRLTADALAGAEVDLRVFDASFSGVALPEADLLSDAIAGPVLDALGQDTGSPLAGAPAGALAAGLTALGLASLTGGGTGLQLDAAPMASFLADPSAWLSTRLLHPEHGAPLPGVLEPVFSALGLVAFDDGGGWRLDLLSGAAPGRFRSFDILADGRLRFREGGTAHATGNLVFDPYGLSVEVDLEVHPEVAGEVPAALVGSFSYDPGLPEPALGTLALLPRNSQGALLLPASGLSLAPPAPDLGEQLLMMGGKVAAGLFMALVVEDRLLPFLASEAPNVLSVLQTLGLVNTSSPPKIVASMDVVQDPIGFFLAPAKLDALQTTLPFPTPSSPVAFVLDHDGTVTPRTLSATVQTTGSGLVAGDLSLTFSAGVQANLPASGQPTFVPVADGTLTAQIDGAVLALTVGVVGPDVTLTLDVTPAGGSPVQIQLLPWSGLAEVLGEQVQQQLLPLGLEKLVDDLRTSTDVPSQHLGTVLGSLLLGLGVLTDSSGTVLTTLPVSTAGIDVDGVRLKAFTDDPAAAWHGLYDPTDTSRSARVNGWLGMLDALALLFPAVQSTLLSSAPRYASASARRVSFGSDVPVAFDLGLARQSGAPSDVFGLWLALDRATWQGAAEASVALLPDATQTSVAGVYLDTADGSPELEFALHLDVTFDLDDLVAGVVFELDTDLIATSQGPVELTVSLVEQGSSTSLLVAEVLPTVSLSTGALPALSGTAPATVVLQELLLPLALGALCIDPIEAALLDVTIEGNLTPGALLAGLGLLTDQPSGAPTASLVMSSGNLRPVAITHLRNLDVFDAVLGATAVAIEGLTSLPVGPYAQADGSFTRYGIQLAPADPIVLSDDPTVELLLGKGAANPEMTADDFRGRVQLLTRAGTSVNFRPGLDLRGIGLRVNGANQGPLVTEPVGIKAFEVGLDTTVLTGHASASDIDTSFGALAHLDGLMLSVGGDSGSNDTNPVAAALFDEQASIPEIDLTVSYRERTSGPFAGEHSLRISLNGTANDGLIWLNVDRQIGPLDVAAIGFGFVGTDEPGLLEISANTGVAAGTQFTIQFDASFGLGPLTISAWGLGVEIPLDGTDNWGWTLRGLGLMYASSGLTVAGAFLEDRDEPGSYVGGAMIQAGTFELAAIGGYKALDDGSASLFVLAHVPVPLGGPPFFFVMGLAGGFGVNRSIALPPSAVDATDPDKNVLLGLIGGNDDLFSQFDAVADFFPVQQGALWFAAGVKFNSFGFIDGAAMLYVLLDRGFTLGLLGLANLALPTKNAALVQIELALDAGFSTTNNDPRMWVNAFLTDNSYLIDPSCRVTGGFSLYVWFARGDFVLSIGGFTDAYDKPSHYPDVPRVGFHWQVSSAVVCKGGAYFALTPREAMGGGFLEISGKWGPAKAWFEFSVDVMIGWDPFYYYFKARLSIGGSIDLGIFGEPSFSLTLELKVEGPKVGGYGKIKICGIGVKVKFGAQNTANKAAISTDAFATRQLGLNGSATALQDVFTMEVVKGEVVSREGEDRETTGPFVVDGEAVLGWRTKLPVTGVPGDNGRAKVVFSVGPAMGSLPINQFDVPVRDPSIDGHSPWSDVADPIGATHSGTTFDLVDDVDLVPCAKSNLTSTLVLAIQRKDGEDATDLSGGDFRDRLGAYTTALPKANYQGSIRQGADGRDAFLPDTSGDPSVRVVDRVILNLEPELAPANADQILFTVDEDGTFALPFAATRKPGTFDRLTEQIAELGALDITWAHATDAADPWLSTAAVTPLGADLSDTLAATADTRAVRLVSPLKHSQGFAFQPMLPRRPDLSWLKQPAWQTEARLAAPVSNGAVGHSGTRFQTTDRAFSKLPRIVPPTAQQRPLAFAGLELITVSSSRPTHAAAARPNTLRRGQSVAHNALLAELDTDLQKEGMRLTAGQSIVLRHAHPRWASKEEAVLTVAGDQAVRVMCLNRGGEVLADLDVWPGKTPIQVPRQTTRLVTTGLGRVTVPKSLVHRTAVDARTGASADPRRFAAAASAFKNTTSAMAQVVRDHARGGEATLGFDHDHPLLQVGPNTFAARGASVQITHGQPAKAVSLSTTPAARLLRDVTGLRVRLPAWAGCVAVVLSPPDRLLKRAPDAVSLNVSGKPSQLGPVVLAEQPDKVALLRDVQHPMPFDVTVHTEAGWRVTGVMLLPGSTGAWHPRLQSHRNWALVEDGPIGPTGTSTVRLEVKR